MKKGSFKGLLCREFYLIKPSIPEMLIGTLSMTVLSVLVVLSFRFGNLALIEELKFEDFAEGIKLFPVLGAAMFSLSAADATVRDISPVWERFRKTTPVSAMRLALAKYAAITIVIAASVFLSFGTLLMMCAVVGTPVTAGDIALTLAVIAFCVLYVVSGQLLITYFRHRDKGMLATMVVLMGMLVMIFTLTDSFSKEGRNTEEVNAFVLEVKNALVDVAPIMVLVIIVLICGGCYATAMLYKRREK
ncbi:MAG: ABC transporter permease [Oscillospiraceae bacterium]|nr:ABC transporter permease [Oscillospiraceae bacterium]